MLNKGFFSKFVERISRKVFEHNSRFGQWAKKSLLDLRSCIRKVYLLRTSYPYLITKIQS